MQARQLFFGQPVLVILRGSEVDSLDFTPASPVNFMFEVFLKYLSLSDFPQIAEVQVVFISFLTNVVVCSFTYLYWVGGDCVMKGVSVPVCARDTSVTS